MKKKLIAVLLAATTTLSLTGCSLTINGKTIIGGDDEKITVKESEDSEDEENSDSEETEEEKESEEESEEVEETKETETKTEEVKEKTNAASSISTSDLYAVSVSEFRENLSDSGYLVDDLADDDINEYFISSTDSEYVEEASFAMSSDYGIMILYLKVSDPEKSLNDNTVGEVVYASIKSQMDSLGKVVEEDGVRYTLGCEDGDTAYAIYNIDNVVVLAAANTDDTSIPNTIATEILSGNAVSINSIYDDESSNFGKTESEETNKNSSTNIKSSGTIYADELNFAMDENGKYYVEMTDGTARFSAKVDTSSLDIDQYDTMLFMNYEKEYNGINYYFDIDYSCSYIDVDDQDDIADYFENREVTSYSAYNVDGSTIYIGQKETSEDGITSVYMYALEDIGSEYFLEVDVSCYNFDDGNYIEAGDLAQTFIVAP